MLKIPINILLSLTVFIFCIGGLLLIFGSPKCDSLANSTAYYLKNSIDEVSKDTFYSYDKEGVPTNEEVSYYRTAPIMLCQDKGISYLETILGTTVEPQYKIYFETFPEGGGGIWTEAYPWSGGAATTLRMWSYMRIGTGVLKISAKYLTKIGMFKTFMDGLYGASTKVKKSLAESTLDQAMDLMEKSDEFGPVIGGPAKFFANEGRPARWMIEVGKTAEGIEMIEEGVTDGTFAKIAADGTAAIDLDTKKLIISAAERVVEVPVEMMEGGNLVTYYTKVYAKYSGGEIVEITTGYLDDAAAAADDFVPLKVSPSDMYKDWLETLTPSTRETYEKMYIPEGDFPGIKASIAGMVRETNFYKNYYQPLEKELKTFAKKIETLGYRIDITEFTTARLSGFKLGAMSALDDDYVADMLLKQDGIRDRIASLLGKSADEIQASHIKNFINQFKLDGIGFLVKGQDFEIPSLAINKIMEASDAGTVFTRDGLFDAIVSSTEGNEIINSMSQALEIDQAAATARVGDIVDRIFPSYSPAGYTFDEIIDIGKNEIGLASGFTDSYLRYLGEGFAAGDEKAAANLGLFLGFIEQNKGALPTKIVRTRTGLVADYFVSQSKKMIYLDGPQNMLNPASFYARAYFANLATKGCEGNSICVYSYNAMSESPMYLNETADKYDIRVWRPVESFKQALLWQSALQRIPSNPRFHVVSPCLANAKIWKTTYDNKPTIFVYPEKVDMGGDASNYCYADTTLVNEYMAIWALSDTATIITTVTGFGAVQKFLKLPSAALKTVSSVINIADPVTLAQGIAEGFLSWPGLPFKPMSWEQISANAGKIGIKQIQVGSEKTK